MRAALTAGLACIACVPVAAAQCLGPEIATMRMRPAGDVSAVMVGLDARPWPLIVDTGASHVALDRRAAMALGLVEHDAGVSVATGIGGVLTRGLVDLRELNLGGMRIAETNVPLIGLPMPSLDGQRAAGVLGTSVLGRFDVDLDFAQERLTLFLRSECDDVAPPWTGAWSRLPLATEPTNLEGLIHHDDVETSATGQIVYRGDPRPNHARLFTVVRVNGVPMIAAVDTGASVSTLTPEAAARAGLADHGQALTLIGIDQHPVDGRLVIAERMSIGADERTGVTMGVADIDIGQTDMLLGHDLMNGRRILISFGAPALFWQVP